MVSSKNLLLCFSFDEGNLVVIQNQKGRELLANFFAHYIDGKEKENKYIEIKNEIISDKNKNVNAYWIPNNVEQFKHFYDLPSKDGDIPALGIDLMSAIVNSFKDETEAFLTHTKQREKTLQKVLNEAGKPALKPGKDKIRVFKAGVESQVKAIDKDIYEKKLEDMKWVVY